jgi:CRISPR-associated protein Csm2
MPPFNYKNFNPKWINEEITDETTGNAYIDYLSGLGFFLCDKKDETDRFPGYGSVTTSQLRNIFSEVKRIEVRLDVDNSWQTDLIMLRPKIAYNTARTLQRTRNSRMKELREVLENALKEVKNDKKNFERFAKFFEGIIAYHKVYGGKD